ncbi:hypothetical protein Tco_0433377 [Tanacetum coccineum]
MVLYLLESSPTHSLNHHLAFFQIVHSSIKENLDTYLTLLQVASEEHKDGIQPSKKPKITIIPPKQLFIDLTNEDTITSSPNLYESSPSALNAPSKTPSTKDTSFSSIDYTPKSPTLSSSPSINGYLNPPLLPPPRVPPPPPTQAPNSMEITLSLSPITPLVKSSQCRVFPFSSTIFTFLPLFININNDLLTFLPMTSPHHNYPHQ